MTFGGRLRGTEYRLARYPVDLAVRIRDRLFDDGSDQRLALLFFMEGVPDDAIEGVVLDHLPDLKPGTVAHADLSLLTTQESALPSLP